MKLQRLHELRKSSKYTQQEIADLLNINRNTYAGYELGNSEPDFETTLNIARLFGVSIDYLLGNSSIPFDINYNSMKTEAGKLRSRISTKLISLSENDLKTIETLVDRMIKN